MEREPKPALGSITLADRGTPLDLENQAATQKWIQDQEKFPERVAVSQISSSLIQCDQLSAEARLANFKYLVTGEKVSTVNHVIPVLRELGANRLTCLNRLFQDILNDRVEIRQALLRQLPALIDYLSTQDQPVVTLQTTVLPLISKLVQQTNATMKQLAGQSLIKLSGYLDQESRGESVLKQVLELAHDDTIAQNRVLAVQLFAKMASLFGKDMCQQFIGFQFQCLGQDADLRVKRETIINLPSIARVVGAEFFRNRIFQFYQDKAKQTQPALRKALVEIISEISNLCQGETKDSGALDSILLEMLRDPNKFVKAAAYKQLGAYIHSLKGSKINPKLIEAYVKMSTPELDTLSTNNDIVLSCAYNFPAVLDAIGTARWSDLTSTYSRLLKIPDKRVRQTLASSLHEVSRIIGQKRTQQHLFTVLDKFLRDPRDEIRIQAIRHLCQILGVLNAQKRQEIADIFMVLQSDQRKWRIRECIAEQLVALTNIFQIHTVYAYLIPVAFRLCSDPVSCVRERAAFQIAGVFKKFESEEGQLEHSVVGKIPQVHPKTDVPWYIPRFITICQSFLGDTGTLTETLFPLFEGLSRDETIDVRISLARFLCSNPKSSHYAVQLGEMAQTLKKDPCEDVRECFLEEQN